MLGIEVDHADGGIRIAFRLQFLFVRQRIAGECRRAGPANRLDSPPDFLGGLSLGFAVEKYLIMP